MYVIHDMCVGNACVKRRTNALSCYFVCVGYVQNNTVTMHLRRSRSLENSKCISGGKGPRYKGIINQRNAAANVTHSLVFKIRHM